MKCHLCGHPEPQSIEVFSQLGRVTSDCKPWPAGGTLFFCPGCGTVVKATDQKWLDEIQAIYSNYTIYPQSGGFEQPVHDPLLGQFRPRSEVLLSGFLREFPQAPRGRLLDVGCGRGGFLQAFHRQRPGWSLVGTELSAKYKEFVENLPGVELMHAGPVEDLPGTFDLVTLVHVLEHIPYPTELLRALRARLADGGLLVLDLPAFELNPTDLVVADHCSHFSAAAIRDFLSRVGFTVQLVTTEWITKERVVVAVPGQERAAECTEGARTLADVQRTIDLLAHLMKVGRTRPPGGQPWGVFGSSIAGTWLYSALEGDIRFWVDEDPHRIGKEYLGKPIYSPAQAPAGSDVLIPLAPSLCAVLQPRLQAINDRVRWHVP